MNFTYQLPLSFESHINQYLKQRKKQNVAEAFKNCKYTYDDVGLAFYAGLRGDNWDKHALDFTFEGSKQYISLLKENEATLSEIIEKSLHPSESGFLVRNIDFLFDDSDDFIPSSNKERLNADIMTANEFLKDLLDVCERICSNSTYNSNSSENSINDFIRDMLTMKGYLEVKDQTRHGISSNGNDAGEVDLLVSKDGKEVAIVEGLKLKSVDTGYISQHINKAVDNYNALGTATFIVAYVSSSNYAEFWNRFLSYIENYEFQVKVKKDVEELPYLNASTRIATTILSRDNYDFPVYFVCIKNN